MPELMAVPVPHPGASEAHGHTPPAVRTPLREDADPLAAFEEPVQETALQDLRQRGVPLRPGQTLAPAVAPEPLDSTGDRPQPFREAFLKTVEPGAEPLRDDAG